MEGINRWIDRSIVSIDRRIDMDRDDDHTVTIATYLHPISADLLTCVDNVDDFLLEYSVS
jgi:hypothetical protein